MIAHILPFLMIAAVVMAGGENSQEKSSEEENWPLKGIDPNTLSCDPLGEVFLLLPHFKDCSKYFMCAHGKEVEFTCPATLIFDFVRQTCNWNWGTQCYLRDHLDLEGSGFSEGEIGMFGEELENGPIDSLTAESSGTVRPVSALTARLFNGVLNCYKADEAARHVAYKGDCQRYWKCVGSVPQAFYCSDGLLFNENTQQCDHEANVKCDVVVEDELQGEFIVYK